MSFSSTDDCRRSSVCHPVRPADSAVSISIILITVYKLFSICIMLGMTERFKLDAILFFLNLNVLVTAAFNSLHFMTLHLIFREEI